MAKLEWLDEICYWYEEVKDMGATFCICSLEEVQPCRVPYHCKKNCEDYISRADVKRLVLEHQNK